MIRIESGMNHTHTHVRVAVVGIVAIGLLGFLPSCKEGKPASNSESTQNHDGHDHEGSDGVDNGGDSAGSPMPDQYHYTVRGEIEQLPSAENPLDDFRVHHEAIHTFVNRKGEMKGMNSMTMPFPLGEGVRLDGFAVGEKISMEFTVVREPWGYHVTGIKKLPAETELTYGKADPTTVPSGNNEGGGE